MLLRFYNKAYRIADIFSHLMYYSQPIFTSEIDILFIPCFFAKKRGGGCWWRRREKLGTGFWNE